MKKHFRLLSSLLLLSAATAANAQASEENPLDCTSYIANPSFENGTSNWVSAGLSVQSNSDFTYKDGTVYLEKWVASGGSAGSASIKQTIVGLPMGVYRLTAGAQNLSQNSTSKKNTGVYIYAGQQQEPVYTPNDYSLTFTHITGQEEIGFVSTNAGGNWIAVDNFRLYKIGEVTDELLRDTLQKKIDETLATYDESKNGAAELMAEIKTAQNLLADSTTPQDAMANELTALEKAQFAFVLANAQPGTGTAPKVTTTNHYVATGSTEALVRATMTGSNILERGVCWSTEHNPTVLDNTTTEYHSLNGYIFHIRNLTPATVYYVRPYVMNKTYTVAYGDEVKIVTHPKGTCVGTWNEGAPTEAANARCRIAIKETIEYFNQWTGIRGFTLTGNYGAGTATADCSYGGWMRIGPNAGNQAIGTVIHETGHGVGVGTSSRWWDTNVHNWQWFGREANEILHFLENKYTEEVRMVGDGTHGWGENATYDWFVNGADKDKHEELQYLGGCILLYGLFIDGLCPTYSYPNGLSGYTYNFDDSKKYYLMSKDEERGLGNGLLFARSSTAIGWKPYLTNEAISDSAAWYIEYNAQQGYYMFKNALNGRYLTHSTTSTSVGLRNATTPSTTEYFQLMPDRTDVTIKSDSSSITTHGYWFTWYSSENKSMQAGKLGALYGSISQATFDYSDNATQQQWIIISEDELEAYQKLAKQVHTATGIEAVYTGNGDTKTEIVEIYNAAGVRQAAMQKGVNIVKYSDGTIKKILR